MVQVTLDDTQETDRFKPSANETAQTHTSEGDLLKAHVVAWRSEAQLDHENPFKPGTELSWEADLMVRLIQRGYPIDELPHLVEAAKSEAAKRRSKSCERVSGNKSGVSGGGFLRSNLRQADQSQQQTRSDSNNQSSQLKAGKPNARNGNNNKSHSDLTTNYDENYGWEPSRETQLENLHQENSKTIWANSLKRAKSMPRFNKPEDADSLDKLITSIELEISDVQERKASGGGESRDKEGTPQASCGSPRVKGPRKVRTNSKTASSPTKTQAPALPERKTSTKNKRPQTPAGNVKSVGSPIRQRGSPAVAATSNSQQDYQQPDAFDNKGNSNLQAQKKKRPKCCRIQ